MRGRGTAVVTSTLRAFDTVAVQQYFAGVEALAREARASRDPRVLMAALKILKRQNATVSRLLEGTG